MAERPGLEVSVVKAVKAPVAPASVRESLLAAGTVLEVAARLPAGAALTVRITGDRELRRLNRTFLGEDRPTDVLSFPSGEEGGYLGDLAVSWPAVERQAQQFGHTPEAELRLLCVHGLLHLLGWDHASAAQEREMTRLTLASLETGGIRPAAGRL